MQHSLAFYVWKILFSSVQSFSRVQLFATPWITALQASLSITNSRSSLRLTSIESVMPSIHLILCRPFLLLPTIPPSIRLLSNESTLHMTWPKYLRQCWGFWFNSWVRKILWRRDKLPTPVFMGFPGSPVKNLPAMWETWVWSLGWKDPVEEGMATHSSLLAWKIPIDRGAWLATVHGVEKSQTRLSN